MTAYYDVIKTALLDYINRNKKYHTTENETNQWKFVPSQWLCLRKYHNLSVNEAVNVVVTNCSSLATIYEYFNDLGFSYIMG